MAEMTLILAYGLSGNDVTPQQRMTMHETVTAHVGEALAEPLTREEMSKIMYAAKMEFAKLMRLRSQRETHLSPDDPKSKHRSFLYS